jgi:hypothetical protein
MRKEIAFFWHVFDLDVPTLQAAAAPHRSMHHRTSHRLIRQL